MTGEECMHGLDARIESARESHPGTPVDCYVLFTGRTDAIALFEASKNKGVPVRVSPTPRAARATCGIALLVSCSDVAAVAAVADAELIPIESIAALPRQIDPKRDHYC